MPGMQDLVTPPSRVSIYNLWTHEEVVAQRNPPTFDDEVGSVWEKLGPIGQSHEAMHFKHTSNYTVTLDLAFRAFTQAEYEECNRARHYLLSWSYPLGADGPPRLLVTWPMVFSIECQLMSCKLKNERFLSNGAVAAYTATIMLEEARNKRITADQVAHAVIVRGEELEEIG